MGCICQKVFASSQQEPANHKTSKNNSDKYKAQPPSDTDRKLKRKQPMDQPVEDNEERKNSLNEHSLSNSAKQSNLKTLFKCGSTGCGTDSERRLSSLSSTLQPLDSSSIIIKHPAQNTVMADDEYYTVISGVYFIKKTMDRIKVTTPNGQSELSCPPQYISSTLFFAEGLPLEGMEEISPGKFLQTANSPISIKIKLKCSCGRQIKTHFCKGFINFQSIKCSDCQKSRWKIQDIEANAPMWGDGRKIQNHEKLDRAPQTLRVMGCILCLRYSNCIQMRCGCFICRGCQANSNQNLECRICELYDMEV